MAWEHLSVTSPHLVYLLLGAFTSLFMLCSTIIKERMYIGEATIATIFGLIFGPHAAKLIDPISWGNVDIVTLEFSRIVLVVQCFAVGVELPKFYMERHWKSVIFLLVPVMTFGWLITSLFIWWLIEPLSWLDSLVIAACVTATDPVLASSVVGKGKFAKRVPKHLRDLLSAESGCNDGMAFPFIYLSLYLIQDKLVADKVSFHWIVYTVLYECLFGAVYGFLIGYIARHGIKFAEKHELIDRESFLVFYFVLALFCAGSGSVLGVDDLLVGFAAGVGFSNDGWFGQKTEESHVSNVIDLLLNLTYFVFLGTIIPWEMFNNTDIGLGAWRLTVIAILVIFFRRIPIMLALKPFIPDIKTWREALFAGHFGPIGVGAIFIALLARAELEHHETVPLPELPPNTSDHYTLLLLVWPIVTFMVVASILVHGSSIAVFTLGKHINTLTITMSYTTANEEGPSWMNRLPRISSQSRSQARTMSDTSLDDIKMPDYPPGTLPPVGANGQFLRRQKEEEATGRQGSRPSSLVSRRRRKKWDDGIGPGGPITMSAVFPQRRSQSDRMRPTAPGEPGPERQESTLSASDVEAPRQKEPKDAHSDQRKREDDDLGPRDEARSPDVEVYDEGDHVIVENQDGEVLAIEDTPHAGKGEKDMDALKEKIKTEIAPSGWTYDAIKKRLGHWKNEEIQKRKDKEKVDRKHEPARAYQFGNTIIVEDEDGEVVKTYELPAQGRSDVMSQSLKYMGMAGLVKPSDKANVADSPQVSTDREGEASARPPMKTSASNWRTFVGRAGGDAAERQRKKSVAEEEAQSDDLKVRFTIGGVGQRLTKEDFIKEMQKLDKGTRKEVVDQSSASQRIKTLAKQDPNTPLEKSDPFDALDRGKGKAVPALHINQPTDRSTLAPPGYNGESSGSSSTPSGSSSSSPEMRPTRGRTGSIPAGPGSSEDVPESAAERRRRLAVLQSVDDDSEDGVNETPAERRRREAALGVTSPAPDDDSEDDDTPRVPPARRGIRFADVPAKAK